MKCEFLKNNIIVGLLLIPIFTFSQIDNEANFYKPTTEFKVIQNFKKDYKVDNSFESDDSEKLQKAINSISNKGGGKLIIPKGNYSFVEIWLKSNVHIEIEHGAVIKPTNRTNLRNHAIFHFTSNSIEPIKNVSVTGVNGRFEVDLRSSENKRVRVFNVRNIHNFLISEINIIDAYTLFASLEFLPYSGPKNKPLTKLYSSRNGVVKNIEGLGIADYGYGLVQVRTGKNILFKNLGGIGGTTLRLEGHLKKVLEAVGGKDIMANIIGRNIRCEKGNSAVMLSPHYIFNGYVDVRDITAVGCGIGVRIERGFANKREKRLGLTAGYFDSKSKIKDVKVIFSKTKAQIKPKHYKYQLCELRSLNEKEPIVPCPHGDSYEGPSIAGVVYTSNYTIDFNDDDLRQSTGFAKSQKIVRIKDVKICK